MFTRWIVYDLLYIWSGSQRPKLLIRGNFTAFPGMRMATATAYSKREIAFDELGKGKLRRDSHPISRVVCCSRLYLRRKGARSEEGCSHAPLSSREGPGLKPGISKGGSFQEGGSILQGPLRHLFSSNLRHRWRIAPRISIISLILMENSFIRMGSAG